MVAAPPSAPIQHTMPPMPMVKQEPHYYAGIDESSTYAVGGEGDEGGGGEYIPFNLNWIGHLTLRL